MRAMSGHSWNSGSFGRGRLSTFPLRPSVAGSVTRGGVAVIGGGTHLPRLCPHSHPCPRHHCRCLCCRHPHRHSPFPHRFLSPVPSPSATGGAWSIATSTHGHVPTVAPLDAENSRGGEPSRTPSRSGCSGYCRIGATKTNATKDRFDSRVPCFRGGNASPPKVEGDVDEEEGL